MIERPGMIEGQAIIIGYTTARASAPEVLVPINQCYKSFGVS